MLDGSVITALLFSLPFPALAGERAGSVDQDPSDPYFDIDHVLDVAIEIAPEAWDSLRVQKRTLSNILSRDCGSPYAEIFSWFRATVTVDGETYAEVGVRKKGFFGSLSDLKPALKIRFDKFVDEQLLGGLMRRMTLNNVLQDKSMLNTCMAYRLFAQAGLPAPRCNFATVSVNGKALGLYVHVESIKAAFLERNFSNPQGSLYEGTLSDFRPGFRGTFEKKTNQDQDWSDVDAVTAALKDPSPAGLDAPGGLIDIDSFLSFWAAEVLIGHWDGYAGNRNNYYVYREPDGPFRFIPWGADAVFTTSDVPFDQFVSPESVLAHGAIPHRLYREEAMRRAYVQRLVELLDTVWNEKELLELADRMEAIVQSHVLAKNSSEAAKDADRVRRFIRQRRAVILADIDPQPPAWPWPLTAPFCGQQASAFDLHFETTWWSLGRNPALEGSVTVSNFQRNGKVLSFHTAGATAGTEDARGGTGDAPVATLTVVAVTGDSAHVLTVSLPVERVSTGSNVVLDGEAVSGLHLLLRPPYERPEVVELIADGEIEFAEADTRPGGKISGRFHGTIISFAAASPTFDPVIGDVQANVGVVINEVAAQGDSLDWFELYNASHTAVDLAGLLLADDLQEASRRVPLPSGFIEAGSYRQIQLDKNGWPGFALGRGEELGIWTLDGKLVDGVDWEEGQSDRGTSFARIPDITGDFQTVDHPTPNAPNWVQTAIFEQRRELPEAFELLGNWPNPFNPNTVIDFDLSQAVTVHLVIYDSLGRRVRTLHAGEILVAGHHRSRWNGLDDEGRPAASGVYVYRLTVGGGHSASGRMALTK